MGNNSIPTLVWALNNRQLAIRKAKGEVVLWEFDCQQAAHTTKLPRNMAGLFVRPHTAIGPNANHILMSSTLITYDLFDLSSHDVTTSFPALPMSTTSWSRDLKSFAIGSDIGVFVYNFSMPDKVFSIPIPKDRELRTIALSPNGAMLVIGYHLPKPMLYLVDITTGKELTEYESFESSFLTSWTPDGKSIVGIGGELRIWDVQSRALRHRVPLDSISPTKQTRRINVTTRV
jgi:Tol biopolymer transport system component